MKKEKIDELFETFIVDARQSTLTFTLGKWAENCLRNQTPLTLNTLKAWVSTCEDAAQVNAVSHFLSELNVKDNVAK